MTPDAPIQLTPVILSGGSGMRLWPVSRTAQPKQFLSLNAEGPSLLQATALRLHGLDSAHLQVSAPIIVCNSAHRFLVAQQLAEIGIGGAALILEPQGRNTAPALTLAALALDSRGAANHLMLAMPADHQLANPGAFLAAVHMACPHAGDGAMVAFGVLPQRPETGYGYMQRGAPINAGAWTINRFVEKPDAATAAAYVEAGRYFWNSGVFMVRARDWLAAIAHYRPDILGACRAAMDGARKDLDFIRPDAAAFAACPSDSIDCAVMERLPADPAAPLAARIVPLDAGWSDIGAWDAVWAALPHDGAGNAGVGPHRLHDCRATLAYSSGRLIAGIGLDQLLVVETPDAVLVADRRHAQGVKSLVEQIQAAGLPQADAHRKVHRPWGWFDGIDAGPRFQVKRITVNPGASLSLQRHRRRSEHWVVVKGTAEVTRGSEVFSLQADESVYIPAGTVHRLANRGAEPLELIEVQSGDYLGEDDIERLDDTQARHLG